MTSPEHAVPRSMKATDALSVARVAGRRRAQPNGWWGIAVLVASEATLFGCLFGTYFYLRFNTRSWPPPGTPEPHVVLPLVLACVLALTTVPVALAALAAEAGRARLAWAAIFAALVVQSGYFAFEVHSFVDDLDKFTPQDNAYGSIYYTLLGADQVHVAVGLLLSLFLLARLLGGLTNYRVIAVRSIAFYWYFVNVLTLLVAGAIVSAAL